jgi:hypothetical protein
MSHLKVTRKPSCPSQESNPGSQMVRNKIEVCGAGGSGIFRKVERSGTQPTSTERNCPKKSMNITNRIKKNNKPCARNRSSITLAGIYANSS